MGDLWHLFIGGKIVAPFEVTILVGVNNTDSQRVVFFLFFFLTKTGFQMHTQGCQKATTLVMRREPCSESECIWTIKTVFMTQSTCLGYNFTFQMTTEYSMLLTVFFIY